MFCLLVMPQGQPSPISEGEQPPPLPPRTGGRANSTVDRTILQQLHQRNTTMSLQNHQQWRIYSGARAPLTFSLLNVIIK